MKDILFRVTVFYLFLILAGAAYGQTGMKKSGNARHHPGYSTADKSHTAKKSYSKHQNGNLFNKHRAFHHTYYKSHEAYGGNSYKASRDHKHDRKHDRGYHKHAHGKHREFYNNYEPYYYGPVIYYNDFEPYGYYGYDTTLGTYPRRPSNVEVNRYLDEYYGGEDYQEQEPYLTDPYYEDEGEYVYDSDDGQREIYVFVDEYGVEHYVNDMDTVPEEYIEEVRTVTRY